MNFHMTFYMTFVPSFHYLYPLFWFRILVRFGIGDLRRFSILEIVGTNLVLLKIFILSVDLNQDLNFSCLRAFLAKFNTSLFRLILSLCILLSFKNFVYESHLHEKIILRAVLCTLSILIASLIVRAPSQAGAPNSKMDRICL